MNQTMQWWKNAVYLNEIVMLADKNSLISDKLKTMDEIQNRYPLVCKYGPQTVDLVPIILQTSPKFGKDRLILRFLVKILKKKNGKKYSRMY